MSSFYFIYAGRLERFFAYLLDTLILLLPKMMLIQLFGLGATTAIGAVLCEAAYFTLFLSGSWQATPGQRMLSIYVIHTDGRALSQADALERFIAALLPFLPVYSSVFSEQIGQAIAVGLMIFWYAPIIFTEERAGVHDQICRTRVLAGKVEDRRR